MDSLYHWISQYGYFGIFGLLVLGIVGIPIPVEPLLVICGTLVAKGKLTMAGTGGSAFAGAVCGSTLSYLIGRFAGRGFVNRWGKYVHFTEENQLKVQQWFDRLGHWVLTVGFFIPLVRHFTALVGGLSGVRYRTLAIYAYPGGVLWTSTFLILGYYLGDNWKQVLEQIHRYSLLIVVAAAVAGAAFYLVRRRKPL